MNDRVRPVEAVEGDLDAKARARPLAVAVLAKQVPVDEEVVGELGVIGDVREVLEDLLAPARNGHADGRGIHGRGLYSGRSAPQAARTARTAEPALEPVDALTSDRLLPAVRAAQLADHAAVFVHVDVLARQRRAPAVDAAALARVETVQRGPPQLALERVWLAEQGHGGGVRRTPDEPCQWPEQGTFQPGLKLTFRVDSLAGRRWSPIVQERNKWSHFIRARWRASARSSAGTATTSSPSQPRTRCRNAPVAAGRRSSARRSSPRPGSPASSRTRPRTTAPTG